MIRRRYTYRGVVQGVGFRPAVYRCATSLGLDGFVRNQRSEVVVEVEGEAKGVLAFPEALAGMLPAASRVDESALEELAPGGKGEGFRIEESVRTSFTLPPIPPDLAICADCARELLDPTDRRYLYPFISCTQCGPRYSITIDTPFDRSTTTMGAFPMCPQCLEEYGDPGDRRFHAQTSACARCGPHLALRDRSGQLVRGDPVGAAIDALAGGAVVALLGLGGFHLAADPRRAAAVGRLRADKRRERKPFALMVRDLEVARRLCFLSPREGAMLCSPASPIVILPIREGAPRHLWHVSDTRTLGILLPYTPLHLLLFLHPQVPPPYDHLVMTSGNLRDEPIITDPEEGIRRLTGTADLFLVHDRRIAFRADDSVLLPLDSPAGKEGFCMFRRSRGFVPALIHLARPVPEPTLALAGDLKSAPALALGSDVYLSPYIGDLESIPAQEAFAAQIERMLELYRVRPARVVHDLHPLYHSSRFAREHDWGRTVAVQHHHAHVLSAMAEHGLEEALGLAFDGTGYGTDGSIWGGEFLHATRSGFHRLGSFAPFALPGGEAAVIHPLRAAFALLRPGFPEAAALLPLEPAERALLVDMLDRSVSSPLTTSLGRVFDAAAAILGVVTRVSYEGEGPIALEGLAAECLRRGDEAAWPADELVPLVRQPDRFLLDPAPLLSRLAEETARGAAARTAAHALLFHRAIASAALRGARESRDRTGIRTLVASGGVFQNALLRQLLFPALERAGFSLFCNTRIPPGDGGLAVGQAWFLGGFSEPG